MLRGRPRCGPLHEDELRQVDVVERFQLVQVPVLVGAEEVPVGAAQERAEQDEQHPQDQEAEQEQRDLDLALVERVVAVALGVDVDVRDRHQPDDDQAGEDDAGQPGVEVDEHLLQAQEVPRRLGGVRACGRGSPAPRAARGRPCPRRPARSCRSP